MCVCEEWKWSDQGGTRLVTLATFALDLNLTLISARDIIAQGCQCIRVVSCAELMQIL